MGAAMVFVAFGGLTKVASVAEEVKNPGRNLPLGMFVSYGVVTLPFATWLMKTFFDDIPHELDEAAIVDGCSNMGAFFKVVLPLAKGGIASTALFVFILNWSDFLVALVLTDRRWTTIPVHIAKLQSALVGAGQTDACETPKKWSEW